MLMRSAAGLALIASGVKGSVVAMASRETLTQEQTCNANKTTINGLKRDNEKQDEFGLLSLCARSVSIWLLGLLVGNSVSCMQTLVREEFRSAPLSCAFC
jgi:hypothetical protein